MGKGNHILTRTRMRHLVLATLAAAAAGLPGQPIESRDAPIDSSQSFLSSCGTPDDPGICYTYLPLVMRPAFTQVGLPVGLNSGGWELLLSDGRRFLPDQAHDSTNGAGYEGGEAITNDFQWEPIDGTDDDSLYHTGRSGLSAYRFNVPNGHYIVELHMAEIRHHGPWFRVFDVAIEGRPVVRSLDLYRLAQHDYAVRFRFAATVADGQLDVTFAGATGTPMVSAVWVDRRAPDDQPPAPPTEVQVTGGYRRAIVRWRQGGEDDIAGYRVSRADTPAGPFQVLSQDLTLLARYLDDAVAVGSGNCYRVAAVDIFGNESQPSPPVCATVIDDDTSSLPVLDLTISPGHLYALAADPFAEVEVPGVLTIDGRHYDVVAEYRGRTNQGSNKKSWKLVADQPLPDWQQATLLLNGEGYDTTLMREKVAYDLYEAVGIHPTRTRFVHLNLNGEFVGVYTQIENPDAEFLRRTGRDSSGDVFKCADGLDTEPDCTNQIVEGRSRDELYTFAAIINRAPEDEFASAIAAVFDVRGLLDYQAITSITGNADATHQFLLYHDRENGRWQLLPWDNNGAFLLPNLPIDYGTTQNPGWGVQVNELLTRVLEVPEYRRYYAERLLALTQSLYSPPNMEARVAAAKAEVWFDAQRDVWKAFREQNEHVATHISYLPIFVNRRIDYVRAAVPAYIPPEDRFIALNELAARNDGLVVDPVDGQAEPWFEIFNAGLAPVDLGGMYLTNSMAAPNRYRIPPSTTLPALGSLLFWADNEPSQGPTHVNFTLAGSGGQVHLVDRDATTIVATVDYASLPAGESWGRFPDYRGQWLAIRHPTPGQPNRLLPPMISNIAHTPLYPQAGEAVTVTAYINDDGLVSSARVVYGSGEPATAAAMFDDGEHGDGEANDGQYGTQIPAFPNGRTVRYYIAASDDYGRTAFDPAAAPVLTLAYRVGYQPPSVAISELMAANAATIEDPDEPGEYPDWIELANTGAVTVSLTNYYLTDNLQQPRKFRISSGVAIPPGGSLVFWADDDPEQGALHTNFKLSKEGEILGLFDRDGATPIEIVAFPAQADDVAYGRCLLAADSWQYLYLPTPGAPNACNQQRLPLFLHQ